MRNRQEEFHQYDDIIDFPCHVSKTRPQMPILDRAAQFSPFAALSGYGDAVEEAMRLTEEQIELDEDSRENLDRKLMLLKGCMCDRPEVIIAYFQPDDRKEGGIYRMAGGKIRKIDSYGHKLIMEDGTILPMESIVRMDSPIFQRVEMQEW